MKENFETIFDSKLVDYNMYFDKLIGDLLKDKDSKYCITFRTMQNLLNENENIRKFVEDDCIINLTDNEINIFHNYRNLEAKLNGILLKEFFILGAKNLNVILNQMEK